MELSIHFTNHQAEVLLYWYENAIAKSERYGGMHISLPQEDYVVTRLRKKSISSRFDEVDLLVILSWMEKTINFGGAGTVYFPFEEETIEKIKEFEKLIENKKQGKNPERDKAIEAADKLAKSKYRTKDQIKEINKKIEKVDFKYDADSFRKKIQETRSSVDKGKKE